MTLLNKTFSTTFLTLSLLAVVAACGGESKDSDSNGDSGDEFTTSSESYPLMS